MSGKDRRDPDYQQSYLAAHAAYARATDPDTSHEAAESMTKDHLSELQTKLLEFIKGKPAVGCTQFEAVRGLGIPHETLTPRFAPLERKGLIYRKHKTRGARGRQVWVYFAGRKDET